MNRLGTKFRQVIDARLQPTYLRFISVTVLLMTGVMLCVSFATSDQGQTLFGKPLSNDFAGFYVAAQILEQGYAARLYDRELHYQLYHTLLPHIDPQSSIPYVHPPFVAGMLRPLTHLPYEVAVAVWLAISASLFGGGCWLLIRLLPNLPRKQTWLILLLALTFEPFLMECWLGGQLSAIGFLSYAVTWLLLSRNRPITAGIALGLCFYKPTLLLLILPLLVIGRQGRILLGMTITGMLLAAISLFFVGWDVCVGYLDVLLSFQKSTSGDGLPIVVWKYVDLHNTLRLLWSGPSPAQRVVYVTISLIPFAWLARAWWRWPLLEANQRQWLWAATLAWLPILNVYVGFYDSILVVQSVLLVADLLLRESRHENPLIKSGVAYCVLAISCSAWFSQHLARIYGVQLYALALITLGFLVFRLGNVRSQRVGG